MTTLANHSALVALIKSLYPGKEQIALHEPVLGALEEQEVLKALKTGYVSSAGAAVDEFARVLSEITGSHAVPLVNGTAALHAALYFSGVGPGDLVITQAMTFVATCNAIGMLNASPLFVDTETQRPSLSAQALANFLESVAELDQNGVARHRASGRAIKVCIPVHCFGLSADIEGIGKVCRRWHIALVEDASQALGSYFQGRHVGSSGHLATLSFNGNKIVTTGGGGAILCPSAEVAAKLRHLCSTARLPGREIEHDQFAFNYRMPNLNAALGLAQLQRLNSMLQAKRALAQRYKDFFSAGSAEFIGETDGEKSNYWLSAVLTRDRQSRDDMLTSLNSAGVGARPAYKPMHRLPMYSACGRDKLLASEALYERVVCLPSGVPPGQIEV